MCFIKTANHTHHVQHAVCLLNYLGHFTFQINGDSCKRTPSNIFLWVDTKSIELLYFSIIYLKIVCFVFKLVFLHSVFLLLWAVITTTRMPYLCNSFYRFITVNVKSFLVVIEKCIKLILFLVYVCFLFLFISNAFLAYFIRTPRQFITWHNIKIQSLNVAWF